MSEFSIDISKLPEDVREKLAELDLELSEGRSTLIKILSLFPSQLNNFYY